MTTTVPSDTPLSTTAPRIVVASTYKDPVTGALYVHQDLKLSQRSWEEEAHVSPPSAIEWFGDVESWAKYVLAFAPNDESQFATWNTNGLQMVLDYHKRDGTPGRKQWVAGCPFIRSVEWTAWTTLANGHAVPQARAIEFIEDHAPDIVDPQPAELANILRSLRTTVHKRAETVIREDGTTAVSWNDDKGVAGRGGTMDLPSEITIGIPVLKGHVGDDGRAVLYSLKVRVRANVDDQARLALRFTIPLAERTIEQVMVERVALADELLGECFSLLRAAD